MLFEYASNKLIYKAIIGKESGAGRFHLGTFRRVAADHLFHKVRLVPVGIYASVRVGDRYRRLSLGRRSR